MDQFAKIIILSQLPYSKRPKSDLDARNMNKDEKAYHASFKPSWATDGTFIYASNSAKLSTLSGQTEQKKEIRHSGLVTADSNVGLRFPFLVSLY